MTSYVRLKRICVHCETEFIAKTAYTKYCTERCNKRHYKVRMKELRAKQSDKETQAKIERPLLELQSKEFLTVDDTSKILNISRSTIWRMMKEDQIKYQRLRGRIIFLKSDLYELFQ